MPFASQWVSDLMGAVEEIRELCAVTGDDPEWLLTKSDVLDVLNRWCV